MVGENEKAMSTQKANVDVPLEKRERTRKREAAQSGKDSEDHVTASRLERRAHLKAAYWHGNRLFITLARL